LPLNSKRDLGEGEVDGARVGGAVEISDMGRIGRIGECFAVTVAACAFTISLQNHRLIRPSVRGRSSVWSTCCSSPYGANFPFSLRWKNPRRRTARVLSLTRTYTNPIVKRLSINALSKGKLAFTIIYLERQADLGLPAVVVEDGGAAAHTGQQVTFAREARGFGVRRRASRGR